MDVDSPFFGAVYCLGMILIGQFFLLNLFLAVIVFAFIKSQKAEYQIEVQILKEEEDKKEREQMIKREQRTFRR